LIDLSLDEATDRFDRALPEALGEPAGIPV
jgi:hypothetical protein